jgi:hypothetical protein
MYTPPAVTPRETPRSDSQASEEEDEEDEDETSQDADLGFRSGVDLLPLSRSGTRPNLSRGNVLS